MRICGGWDEDTCLWGRLGFKGWTHLESNGFGGLKREVVGQAQEKRPTQTYSNLLKLTQNYTDTSLHSEIEYLNDSLHTYIKVTRGDGCHIRNMLRRLPWMIQGRLSNG